MYFCVICIVLYLYPVLLSEPVAVFPLSYLSFRLLGSALPLLSAEQLQEVLSGEVMVQYGEHVVAAQVSGLPAQYSTFTLTSSCKINTIASLHNRLVEKKVENCSLLGNTDLIYFICAFNFNVNESLKYFCYIFMKINKQFVDCKQCTESSRKAEQGKLTYLLIK